MSVVTNNLGLFKETVSNCSTAISIDKSAVKAYYLRAIAESKLNAFDEAIEDIKSAIKLSPADKNLRDEFENIKTLKQKYNHQQQKSLSNLFSSGLYAEKAVPVVKKDTSLPKFDTNNA